MKNADPVVPDPLALFPDAGKGTTADGAPTVINQADLLNSLAPIVSVRSDTFVIRSYGEATDGSGTIQAWCEAVVQRNPDFIDPATPATASVSELSPGGVNERFGRRYRIVSFRWLSSTEV